MDTNTAPSASATKTRKRTGNPDSNAWKNLQSACLRSDGKKLVLQADDEEKFRLILRQEGAHHGITNKQREDEFLNQATVQTKGDALTFEIYTERKLEF